MEFLLVCIEVLQSIINRLSYSQTFPGNRTMGLIFVHAFDSPLWHQETLSLKLEGIIGISFSSFWLRLAVVHGFCSFTERHLYKIATDSFLLIIEVRYSGNCLSIDIQSRVDWWNIDYAWRWKITGGLESSQSKWLQGLCLLHTASS